MKELKFVDVGEGITEGHFQKWLVSDGGAVREDQSIAQIETDKAVVNLPAPVAGFVKQVAKEDSIVKVGDTLAFVGTLDEIKGAQPSQSPGKPTDLLIFKNRPGVAQPQTPQPQAPQQEPAPQPQSTIQPLPQVQEPVQAEQAPAQAGEVIATPFVRKFARDNNVDITKVTGTGPGGRILENDIKALMSQTPTYQKPVQKFSEILEEKHEGEIERIPLSQTRKAIAKNVEQSLTVPSFAHMDLINATALFNIIKKEKPNAEKLGVKLTFLPFIIKAVVEGIKENPNVNASYDHDKQEIIVKKYYNIGLAAEAPDGLKIVVIKDADKKSIIQIAKEIQALHEKINNQTITIEEMRDSTFTITNIGSLGGGFLSVPIINSPNIGILGIHIIRDMPIVDDGMVKVGKILPFSLVFDHRVIDGAEAVKFGNALIKYLEDPDFLEML